MPPWKAHGQHEPYERRLPGGWSTAFDRSKLTGITPDTADDSTSWLRLALSGHEGMSADGDGAKACADRIAGQPYDMEKDITHADMEGLMQAVPR